MRNKGILFFAVFVLVACGEQNKLPVGVNPPDREPEGRDLYEIFRNPSSNYRPFVRWWWNGGKQTASEIERELDLMQEAGIGGVEINTIAFPNAADSMGYPSQPWLSDQWFEMVKIAIDGCRSREMTPDIIVGSGWPYGAEFLTRDQQLQMLSIETFDVQGGDHFCMSRDSILKRTLPGISSLYANSIQELLFLRLLPKHVDAFTPGISYDSLVGNPTIEIEIPGSGEYVLYCFGKLTGYMGVIHGAPGARGPVVNHFDSTAVNAFLNRMSDAFTAHNMRMGDGNLRAAFTDSFELEGANWDRNMLSEFERRRGYDLSPYLPYIIQKVGRMGNRIEGGYGSEFSDELRSQLIDRVRNDYDLTQRELFHEAFVERFNHWCHENGLQSRVQTYGMGLHSLESSMYVDIPECETWLTNNRLVNYDERSLDGHGYTMSNKFVASASLLSGNRRVSCEEITNTRNVFNASLQMIKLTGDLSNLSGVNHSIFHGFNYSPPEVPFPGWVRYGTFINERNTWWPYFRLFTDYKARLSAVFQNAEQQADIALLLPMEDMWSKFGPQRDPFPTMSYPDYGNNLWAALHQNGNGCDHVSEGILQQAASDNGMLRYGTRAYRTLILVEVESMRPETAESIRRFVAAGGLVICVGKEPHRSVGLPDAEKNDHKVEQTIARIRQKYPDRFLFTEGPAAGGSVKEWYAGVQKRFGLTPYVSIDTPDEYVNQNYYRAGDRDIFFFANYHPSESRTLRVAFNLPSVGDKQAWLWDAETGERYKLPDSADDMELYFGPATSKLIVFENGDLSGELYREPPRGVNPTITVEGPWKLTLKHGVEDRTQSLTLSSLVDLQTLSDPSIRYFGGVIDYTTTLRVEEPTTVSWIDTGVTYDGITEVILNGESLGVKWYGDRVFPVEDHLKAGANEVTVRVTTLLGNYAKSLGNSNPATYTWTRNQPYYPLGLAGPVVFY